MKNRILIVEEKHFTRYFDATTDEALHNACVKLLKERLEAGYYKPYKPEEKILISQETINALPEGEVKKAAIAHNKLIKQENTEYENAVRYLQEVQECIDKPMKLIGKTWPRPESYCLLEEFEKVQLEECEQI